MYLRKAANQAPDFGARHLISCNRVITDKRRHPLTESLWSKFEIAVLSAQVAAGRGKSRRQSEWPQETILIHVHKNRVSLIELHLVRPRRKNHIAITGAKHSKPFQPILKLRRWHRSARIHDA
jgi:hypothetical protein